MRAHAHAFMTFVTFNESSFIHIHTRLIEIHKYTNIKEFYNGKKYLLTLNLLDFERR